MKPVNQAAAIRRENQVFEVNGDQMETQSEMHGGGKAPKGEEYNVSQRFPHQNPHKKRAYNVKAL